MMKGLKKANNTLQEFSDLVESKKVSSHNQKNLRVGIDLGTSSIVLSVVNDKGKPIYGAFEYNESIRDGFRRLSAPRRPPTGPRARSFPICPMISARL